jgi:hypothetical protein
MLCVLFGWAKAEAATWRVLWLIMPNVSATLKNGTAFSMQMSQTDINKVSAMAPRFENYIESASGNGVDIEAEVFVSQQAASLSMWNEDLNSYWVGPNDIPADAKAKYRTGSYDSIVATVRLNGASNSGISDGFWGLANLGADNVSGYALVQMLEGLDPSWWLDVAPNNTYPEEVWVHEWVHTLEFYYKHKVGYEFGQDHMPGADDSGKYNYENDATQAYHGFRQFYSDIFTASVWDESISKYVGITEDMWKIRPSIPCVGIHTQQSQLTQGTAGVTFFLLSGSNIAKGDEITLDAGGAAGVSLTTPAVQEDYYTWIRINTTAATPAGDHPMKVTVDGVESNTFTLKVDAAASVATFENDSLGDTSNGGYDDAEKKIVLYYKAGYLDEVSAGIKIKTGADPATISFEGTSDEISVSLASDAGKSDIKTEGIPNISANGSETVRIEIKPGDIVNTIAGVKIVKINGVGIALIGQNVPEPYIIQYGNGGHFHHGQAEKRHDITLEPSYVFLENPQIYQYGNTSSTQSVRIAGPLSAGDHVIGDGPGGIKVEKVYDAASNTFWFESDGPAEVDPSYVRNNTARLEVFADKFRADRADGPIIAGYDDPVSASNFHRSIHLDRGHSALLSEYSVITTVGTVVSAVIPITSEPAFNPDNTVTLLQLDYLNEDTIIPELKTEYNGLALEIRDDTIFVTGRADKAGTANYYIYMKADDKDDPHHINYFGWPATFTIAIAEDDSTPPPAPEYTPRPDPGAIAPPSAEQVEAVKADLMADLGIKEDQIVAADTARIKTSQNVFAEDDGVRTYTAAAVSLIQPVSEGGAAVLGDVFLPLSGKSLADTELPVPDVFSELLRLYSVNKYFQGRDARDGGVLDLLKIYGADLFTYSKEDGGVHLNATVVIVDGPAPRGDREVTSPYNNPEYGVKLSKHEGGGNYLYIFDGVKDGQANDPIALVANTLSDDTDDSSGNDASGTTDTPGTGTGSSGGGGCDAGYGFLLLALAGLALKLRKSSR